LVKKGDKLKLEKIKGKPGETIVFDEVLFIGNENAVEVGRPLIEKAQVTAKIIKTVKEKKVWGIKHKSKKRYKKTFGHRQMMTQVEIMDIKK